MSITRRSGMLFAAVLSVVVSAIHVQDQGGLTVLDDPDWLGWAYRLLELGGLAVAAALIFTAGANWAANRVAPIWAAAALVGIGPFIGFILSRTTGLPGSSDDIGNWSEPLGVLSLVIEGLLFLTAVSALAVRSRATVRNHQAQPTVLVA